MCQLSKYEQEQVEAIRCWRRQTPSVVRRATGWAMKPVGWLLQRIIPDAAMRGLVAATNGMAKWLTDENDIKRRGKVASIQELRSGSLEVCDGLANRVHNWAVGVGTAEGGGMGAGGIFFMAADVPAIITLAFRTIHKIGLCYGYKASSDSDEQFILAVLATSGANSIAEKAAALATLRSVQVALLRQTWKKMGEKAFQQPLSREGGVIALKKLAKQLGINLTKRKALQAVPIVGAVVGASVNGWYIKEVGWAARHAYQERWLIDNGKIADVSG